MDTISPSPSLPEKMVSEFWRGQFAGVVRDEPGTEVVAQRLDDPETGRWGTTRGGQYLHGEDAELRIVAVAVSGFSVDADGLVVADCDLQVDGVQFPVVGERQAVPVGAQPAKAVVGTVGVVDYPAGPGVVDEPGSGEGEHGIRSGNDGEHPVVAVGLLVGAQQPVREPDDGAGLDKKVCLVSYEVGAHVVHHF